MYTSRSNTCLESYIHRIKSLVSSQNIRHVLVPFISDHLAPFVQCESKKFDYPLPIDPYDESGRVQSTRVGEELTATWRSVQDWIENHSIYLKLSLATFDDNHDEFFYVPSQATRDRYVNTDQLQELVRLYLDSTHTDLTFRELLDRRSTSLSLTKHIYYPFNIHNLLFVYIHFFRPYQRLTVHAHILIRIHA